MERANTLWVSHSAISDFDNCKRLYYFKSIYRDPVSKNRVQIVNPYLSLGSAVHDTIDYLIESPKKNTSLLGQFEKVWKNYEGKKGGFFSYDQEKDFRKRGQDMIKRAQKSQVLKSPFYKIKDKILKADLLDDAKLVGALDWIEILPNNNFHIIDFKTGKKEENNDSLQLPIYSILAEKNLKKEKKQNIEKVSYWYLEKDNHPSLQKIDSSEKYFNILKNKALEMKKSIAENDFSCESNYNSCFWCREYESILSGQAEHIGYDKERNKELYYIIPGNEIIKKVLSSSFLTENQKDIFKMNAYGRLAEEISESQGTSLDRIKKTTESIKKKLKDNLTNRELRAFIQEVKKNQKKSKKLSQEKISLV